MEDATAADLLLFIVRRLGTGGHRWVPVHDVGSLGFQCFSSCVGPHEVSFVTAPGRRKAIFTDRDDSPKTRVPRKGLGVGE